MLAIIATLGRSFYGFEAWSSNIPSGGGYHLRTRPPFSKFAGAAGVMVACSGARREAIFLIGSAADYAHVERAFLLFEALLIISPLLGGCLFLLTARALAASVLARRRRFTSPNRPADIADASSDSANSRSCRPVLRAHQRSSHVHGRSEAS